MPALMITKVMPTAMMALIRGLFEHGEQVAGVRK